MAEEDDFEVVDDDVAAKVEEYYNSQRENDNAAADEAWNRLPEEYYDKQNEQRAREAEDREMATDIVANRDPVETTGTPRSISPQPPPLPEEPGSEGTITSGGREALHAAIPGAAGAAGLGYGAMAGAAAGSVIPGIGTLGGGIVGGILGGLGAGSAASYAQEWLLKQFGFDDEAQRAANLKEHPVATGVGTVAGMLPSFGVGGGLALGVRAAGAAIGGGIDYAMTGDPLHALGVAGASAALNKPTTLGMGAIRAGETVAQATGINQPVEQRLSTLLAKNMMERTNNAEAEAPTPQDQAAQTASREAQGATPDGAAAKPADYPSGRPDLTSGRLGAEDDKADVLATGVNKPSIGTAVENPKPLEQGNPSKEPQSQPTRGSRDGAKDQTGVSQGDQDIIKPLGSVDQGLKDALGKPAGEAETPLGIRQQAQQIQPDPFANDPHIQRLRSTGSVIPDPARWGEIQGGDVHGFTNMSGGSVRLKDGTEVPVSKGAGTIFDGQGNIIDPSAVREFRNASDAPWYPVKHPQTPEMIQQLKEAAAKNAAAKENPPNAALDKATQDALAAGKRNEGLMKQGAQLRAKEGGGNGRPPGGPPREPPPPPHEPPEPGPKDARLNEPPLLESKGGGMFNSLRRTFAPEFMSPASEKGAGALRRGAGIMEALNKKWTHTLEKHFPAMEKLIKNGEMEAFTDKVEGGNHFPGYEIPEHLKVAAADIKEMYKDYKAHAATIAKDPEAVKAWNDNYVTHIYKDEPKSFWDRVGGGGVRGSGGSLKARKYDTYAEAKEAEGLEPRHKNILNTAEAYRAELGKHIATEMAKQEMREGGHLKYAMPEGRQGASGQMSSLKESTRIHSDWQPVEGLSLSGRQGYMPRDAANVFNNHLSPGLKGNKYIAPFYQAWREAANRFTSMELGLFNGFHAFVTGGETVLSNQARGVSELGKSAKYAIQGNLKDAGLELTAAGKSILTSPAAPIANYHTGRRFLAIAEGNDKPWSVFSPIRKFKQPTDTERLMVRTSQEAGVMPHGRSYAPDENLSAMGTYTRSYMRGQFGREMYEMAQRIKDSPFKAVPVEVWNALGRSMQTMSEPLFGHYIPALKFGTLMKDYESFLRQGKIDLRTPQGFEAGVRFLRKQSNAMDVRVGEANSQNMFMNKSIQDAGYALLRSFSWARGTGVAILGGPGAVVKTVGEGIVNKDMGAAMRKLANKLDMTHPDYDPNLTYSIAFPFGTALIGTAYQLYKTGEMPKELKDLYLPRTGGMIPGFAGKGEVQERVPLPGYHKEIRGTLHDPVQEVANKQNALLTTLEQQATGKDVFGNPIVRPNATLTENLTDRAKHIQEKLFNPLMLKNVTATPPEGSKISTAERVLGFKGAGKGYTDPEKTEQFLNKKNQDAWDTKMRTKWREEHGGRGNPSKEEVRATYGTAPAAPMPEKTTKEKKPRASSSLLRMPQ